MRGGTENRDIVTIRGTEGAIYVDTLNEGNLTLETAEGKQEDLLPKEENGHIPLIAAFNQSIVKNIPLEVDGRVGLRIHQIIEAVYR